jgi:hypothetical protein
MGAEPDATAHARHAIAEALIAIAHREPRHAAYINGLAMQIRNGKLCLLPSWVVIELVCILLPTAIYVNTPMLNPGDRVSHPDFGHGTIDHFDQNECPAVLFDGRKNLPDDTRMVTFVGIACADLTPAPAQGDEQKIRAALHQAENDLDRSRNAMDASSFHGRGRTEELQSKVTALRATLKGTSRE